MKGRGHYLIRRPVLKHYAYRKLKMVFSNQQLFFLAVLLFPMAALGIEDLYHTCGKNFTQNEILQSNINSVLLALVGKNSMYGAYGVGNDIVYGLTRCQGDMKADACSACITAATQKIRTECPDSAESRIWYDENCFLRYDTENFLGKPEKVYAKVWFSGETPENPKAFEQAVGELLAEVIEATASWNSKFGWGKNHLNANETIYGMAQCTPDLDAYACNQCLEDALENMPKKCKNRTGCRIIGSSCVTRYETYKFLDLSEAAAASAPSIVINH